MSFAFLPSVSAGSRRRPKPAASSTVKDLAAAVPGKGTATGLLAGSGVSISTDFDGLYSGGFALSALNYVALTLITKPAKSTGIGSPSWTDAAYGAKGFRIGDYATDVTPVISVDFLRHDYSRHTTFSANAAGTTTPKFYMLRTSESWLHLFDGSTFQHITKSGLNGAMAGCAGDCEFVWHPTDPNVCFYVGNNGAGLNVYRKTIGSGTSETDVVVGNFTGRLPGGWNPAFMWMKAEGRPSADCRYWAFLVQGPSPSYAVQGFFCWDMQTDTILGTLDASAFGNNMPDHISMSAGGNYVVPSWAFLPAYGTRAYSRDFSSYIVMHTESVHSDLALGPSGEDVYVYMDTDSSSANDGWLMMCNMATGAKTRLSYYYANSGATAGHISGQCFLRPGWVLWTTYADYSSYTTYPASPQLSFHNKLMAVELKAAGRILNIGATQSGPMNWASATHYWSECQGSVNFDFTRCVWASNFRRNDDSQVDAVMYGLPSWAIPA